MAAEYHTVPRAYAGISGCEDIQPLVFTHAQLIEQANKAKHLLCKYNEGEVLWCHDPDATYDDVGLQTGLLAAARAVVSFKGAFKAIPISLYNIHALARWCPAHFPAIPPDDLVNPALIEPARMQSMTKEERETIKTKWDAAIKDKGCIVVLLFKKAWMAQVFLNCCVTKRAADQPLMLDLQAVRLFGPTVDVEALERDLGGRNILVSFPRGCPSDKDLLRIGMRVLGPLFEAFFGSNTPELAGALIASLTLDHLNGMPDLDAETPGLTKSAKAQIKLAAKKQMVDALLHALEIIIRRLREAWWDEEDGGEAQAEYERIVQPEVCRRIAELTAEIVRLEAFVDLANPTVWSHFPIFAFPSGASVQYKAEEFSSGNPHLQIIFNDFTSLSNLSRRIGISLASAGSVLGMRIPTPEDPARTPSHHMATSAQAVRAARGVPVSAPAYATLTGLRVVEPASAASLIHQGQREKKKKKKKKSKYGPRNPSARRVLVLPSGAANILSASTGLVSAAASTSLSATLSTTSCQSMPPAGLANDLAARGHEVPPHLHLAAVAAPAGPANLAVDQAKVQANGSSGSARVAAVEVERSKKMKINHLPPRRPYEDWAWGNEKQ